MDTQSREKRARRSTFLLSFVSVRPIPLSNKSSDISSTRTLIARQPVSPVNRNAPTDSARRWRNLRARAREQVFGVMSISEYTARNAKGEEIEIKALRGEKAKEREKRKSGL